MDYSEYTLKELKDECEKRNLPTYGKKADLKERLEDDDRLLNDHGLEVLDEVVEEPVEDERVEEVVEEIPTPTSDGVFEQVYPTYPKPLTDALHEQFRKQTYESAIAAGHTPIGGLYSAWRVRSEGGHHTYRIYVK